MKVSVPNSLAWYSPGSETLLYAIQVAPWKFVATFLWKEFTLANNLSPEHWKRYFACLNFWQLQRTWKEFEFTQFFLLSLSQMEQFMSESKLELLPSIWPSLPKAVPEGNQRFWLQNQRCQPLGVALQHQGWQGRWGAEGAGAKSSASGWGCGALQNFGGRWICNKPMQSGVYRDWPKFWTVKTLKIKRYMYPAHSKLKSKFYWKIMLKCRYMCFLLMSNDNVLYVEDDAEDVENTGSNIWNYYRVHCAQSKWGGTKNIRCIFCDNRASLTGG